MVEASVLHPFETNPDDASTLEVVVVEEFWDDGGETIVDGASQVHGDADFHLIILSKRIPSLKPLIP